MWCRCNASAAKNFQGSASGAILILWCAGIIMQKKAKKLGNDKLVSMYTMALIKDNKSLDFLPNYMTLKNMVNRLTSLNMWIWP